LKVGSRNKLVFLRIIGFFTMENKVFGVYDKDFGMDFDD
jgi:hypothetical protein